MFHEACKKTHPKMLAGTCPWCGSYVVEGEVNVSVVESIGVAQNIVEGQSLTQVVESVGPLTVETAVRYLCHADEFLAVIHSHDTIHRDIRPKNIVLTDEGDIEILGSPLSHYHEASLVVTHDEGALSAADYLAPEQTINSHRVDERADIYSLGCTLYYLLCGRPPFPDGTLPQRLMRHQVADPQPISDIRPDVPQTLIGICGRMMAKRPRDRFQTADAVATALRDCLDHSG